MISCGWGPTVWTDTHLTYVIDIALTTEFAIAAGGAQRPEETGDQRVDRGGGGRYGLVL